MYLLKVDGDTSTNDCVIALASGISGSTKISSLDSYGARQLQACLDAVSYLFSSEIKVYLPSNINKHHYN